MTIKKLFFACSVAGLIMCSGVTWAGGDAKLGEALAAGCSGCHGADGMGNADNPPAAGLDEAYFVEQLAAYKSGEREHAMMQMFVSTLSEEDMANLAAYYATLGK